MLPTPYRHTTLILLTAVILLGLVLRVVNIDTAPAGIYPDEAQNGWDAYTVLTTGDWQWFYPDNNGREGLYINMIAASFAALGVSILALKLPSIIVGTLTILGTYLLSRELFWRHKFNRWMALASALFVATSFWHINFSRIGFRAILLPLVLVFSFWLLFYGLRKLQTSQTNTNNYLTYTSFLMAGLVFGLGLHTYIAFRIAPAILIILLIMLLITRQFTWRQLLAPLAIFTIGTLISAAPMLMTFAQNPDYLSGRSSVSVFDTANNGGDLPGTLTKTIGLSLGMFNFYGDQNWRHGEPSAATLQPIIGILFLLGLLFSIISVLRALVRHANNAQNNPASQPVISTAIHWFLLAWFGALLAPAFLTTEGLPHALRAIGTLPVVYIFAALGLGAILSSLSQYRDTNPRIWYVGISIILTLLLITSVTGALRYHVTWAHSPQMATAFDANLAAIADATMPAKTPIDTTNIIIAGPLERLPIKLLHARVLTPSPTIFIYEDELTNIAQITNKLETTNFIIFTTVDHPHIINPLTTDLNSIVTKQHRTRLNTIYYTIELNQ